MSDRYILQKIYDSIMENNTVYLNFRICIHIGIKNRPLLYKYFSSYLYNNLKIFKYQHIPFNDTVNCTPDLSLRSRKLWLYLQILKQK